MARHAVHAAMAGKTGPVISCLNDQLVHAPICAIAQGGRRLDLEGELWRAVLSSTGRPTRLGYG
jgi:6-phosphofructokinase 1